MLAAVLENARKLSGRKAERRERFREDEDEDEDNTEGGAAAAKYSDWFDDPAEGQGAEGDGADDVRAQKGEYQPAYPLTTVMQKFVATSGSGRHHRRFFRSETGQQKCCVICWGQLKEPSCLQCRVWWRKRPGDG